MSGSKRPAPWKLYLPLLACLLLTAFALALSIYDLVHQSNLLQQYIWSWFDYALAVLLLILLAFNKRVERYLGQFTAPAAVSDQAANEQLKLTAGLLNSIAAATIAGSFVAPALSGFHSNTIVPSIIAFCLGVLTHALARLIIRIWHRT